MNILRAINSTHSETLTQAHQEKYIHKHVHSVIIHVIKKAKNNQDVYRLKNGYTLWYSNTTQDLCNREKEQSVVS